MESERLKALEREAGVLESRLDVMVDKKSDDYARVLDNYKITMQLIKQETERLEAIEKRLQEDRKLEIERYKVELNGQQERLRASLEEEKLKQTKHQNVWGIVGKVVGGGISLAVNVATMFMLVRFNNSGENLTSQETKFIFPNKPDLR